MNVHFKIEAKKVVNPIILKNGMPELKLSESLNQLYTCFSKDIFMLPYKVKKLSKRARRNEI
jgi:hypothetical protein